MLNWEPEKNDFLRKSYKYLLHLKLSLKCSQGHSTFTQTCLLVFLFHCWPLIATLLTSFCFITIILVFKRIHAFVLQTLFLFVKIFTDMHWSRKKFMLKFVHPVTKLSKGRFKFVGVCTKNGDSSCKIEKEHRKQSRHKFNT